MNDPRAVKSPAQDEAAIASRETDPNVLQRRAARPDSSAWVGASAGAGKTKVLTDRMIRLMLPRADGQPGSDPARILALTFTKAAANEMALRLGKRLSEWAVMEDVKLEGHLRDLLGRTATDEEKTAARRLFARVVDAPGGMKIMTIHSFCQSVLGRFPLEAGLPPHFTALEDGQDSALIDQAQRSVLARAAAEKNSPLADALHHLAGMQDEDSFTGLIGALVRERAQLNALLRDNFGAEGLYTRLCDALDIPPGARRDTIIHDLNAAGSPHESALRRAVAALCESNKVTDNKRGQDIQLWLDAPENKRLALYDRYRGAFLTQKGTIQKTLATQQAQKSCPDILEILSAEAERLFTIEESILTAEMAAATRDLLLLGAAIIDTYTALKEARAALDFDDLILKTLALLEGRTMGMKQRDVAPWVRFKLDQGIDHILIDEAQDTNPEQWGIVKALCDDFFAGDGARDETRTVFVVGDEKQSIFSFQRAAPDKMGEMQIWFDQRIAAAAQTMEDVPINISFRSAPSILQAVDAVLADPTLRVAMGRTPAPHIPFRRSQPGLVELWPVMADADADKNGDSDNEWAIPTSISEGSSGAARLCAHIGDTIDGWLKKGETLPARDRPIEPGDIMILVRTRTAFVGQLVRALKTRGIPVSGVDRMVLKDQLAVQDCLAAARFALLPEDNLALAELLKSPFIGWDDNALYALAQPRDADQSLWAALRADDTHKDVREWLNALIRRAALDHPFEFFSRLLQQPCPADDISGQRAVRGRLGEDALDPLDEFLSRTLGYERGNIPTLQGFVHWHESEASDVKRLMEEDSGAVRIMTVHASKGLQAPIVILPDTLRGPGSKKAERILWPDRSHYPWPLYIPNKELLPARVNDAYDTVENDREREYIRLLYVAMTRAEDRLYIGGYHGKRKPLEESWYYAVEKGLLSLPETQSIPFGGDSDAAMLRLTNPATGKPDNPAKGTATTYSPPAPPAWLRAPAPREPSPPRPLVPSRPSGPLPPAASPRAPVDAHRFRRGTITHTLLQFLPDMPPDKRADAARTFVDKAAHDLPGDVRGAIVDETLAVLTHPDFAALFGPGSLAEISVTGLVDDTTLISGQIDRLLVTDEEILIVDYKTNRPPPALAEDVPDLYVRQLRAYAAALTRIYPGRRVRCALLWTDGPTLMPIEI